MLHIQMDMMMAILILVGCCGEYHTKTCLALPQLLARANLTHIASMGAMLTISQK